MITGKDVKLFYILVIYIFTGLRRDLRRSRRTEVRALETKQDNKHRGAAF